MPQQVAQLIGGAGTGKTTRLLRIMEQLVDRLHDPHLIGFVSFTRAARAEAAERAADRFDMKASELENSGWFRTLHSICYKCLGVGSELLTDNAESRKWLKEALQEEVTGAGDEDGSEVFAGATTAADKALQLWHAARNRLEALSGVWEKAADCDERCPSLEQCAAIVERYEQAKRLDGRSDFTDLLARFAGWKLRVEGAERCRAQGEPPELPVWFFDEQQDASALLDAVCQRLTATEECRWVYVVGDPFQSIYSWAGADRRYFLNWPAAKREIMPKSYRCPPEILALGESVLSQCSDYWDRKIAPADRAGEVTTLPFCSQLAGEIDPRDSWLLIARTNFQARRFAKLLDDAGIPWVPTRGAGGWNAPVRSAAVKALLSLEVGAPIDGSQWQAVLKYLPSKADGRELLAHGTKARFSRMEAQEAQDAHMLVFPSALDELGGTADLQEAIQRGEWRGWIDGASAYAAAFKRWGEEVLDAPKVRVGTVHSVKGQEADNVALLTTISKPCAMAARSQEGRDEEQRVKYVGVTRARKRLLICNESRPAFQWRV